MSDPLLLEIPIDVSQVDRERDEAVRVTATADGGVLVSAVAKIGRGGKATAKLQFDDTPKGLRVFVGPATAEAEELPRLQSLELKVPHDLAGRDRLALEPVLVNPRLWLRWRSWCRTFSVKGRVTCFDGRPVPGATVTAFDIDWCWWWISKVPIASAVTDQDGFYEISFRWCCGWWPWWWWHNRHWRLEPELIDRIKPILELDPNLPEIPRPTPVPDTAIFERLLADIDIDTSFDDLRDANRFGDLTIDAGDLARPRFAQPVLADRVAPIARRDLAIDRTTFEPTRLVQLREALVARLPEVEELTRLRVWPWYPWCGWADCAPDLVFRVTQNCGDEQDKVLLDENLLQTRWNVTTETTADLLTLFGCCRDDTPQPEGDCLNLTHACSIPISSIGGSPTSATAAPAGYVAPGSGDQPFAGRINLSGDFGTASQADFYELEWFDAAAPGGGIWREMPPTAMLGFNRLYHGPKIGGGPVGTHVASFPVREVGGRRVIESRTHFQNDAGGTWEQPGAGSRWWTHNKTMLAVWSTDGFFADGAYRLRIKSWQEAGPDALADPTILGICGAEDPDAPNELTLRVDNQIVTDASTHGDNCGAGTVHTCTDEPETRILEAHILDQNGVFKHDLEACGDVEIESTDQLRVTFRAHDADGHLSSYDLKVTYGDNLKQVLVGGGAIGGVSLGAVGGGPIFGPTYSAARGQGAVPPTWHGDDFVVTAPAASVFPQTCCYQLELRAWKRTIVNCSGSLLHRNLSERSFMVRR